MIIKPNDLLKPNKKTIRPYDCSLIANDGPNLLGKFSMQGVSIPFDSQFVSSMSIPSEGVDQPILYGFLGKNITFLAISVTYLSTVQKSTSNPLIEDKYLEYYFEDDPLVRRTMGDIMILTGTDQHRIPQVYLYNPTKYKAQVQIMAANLDENEINAVLTGNYNTFRGLYYNSIQSDKLNLLSNSTGSTQLEIYDVNNNLLLTLPYYQIEVIEIDGNNLIIKTDRGENITLVFMSEYHRRQAHSRILWVMEDMNNRCLTSTYPSEDCRPPIFNWYVNPTTVYNGANLNKTQLQELFIHSITDDRDGEISKYDSKVEIKMSGSIRRFEEITEIGKYEIYFTISDIAGNSVTEIKELSVYEYAPTIVFTDISVNNTMYINDSWYYKLSGENIINENDIKYYYIDRIDDQVDNLDLGDVVVDIQFTGNGSPNGLTSEGIKEVGIYNITFTVENSAGLTTVETKILKVYTNEYLEPKILFNNDYQLGTIEVNTGLTELDFLNLVVSGFTNVDYDTTVTIDDIELDGNLIFPTTELSYPYDVVFKVKNFSGVENVNQIDRNKQVIVQNIVLSDPVFIFNSWSSSGLYVRVNNDTIDNDVIKSFFIQEVTDLNDGIIPLLQVSATTYDSSNNNVVSEILIDGTYKVIFKAVNSQNRETSVLKYITVDSNIYGGNAFTTNFNNTINGGN